METVNIHTDYIKLDQFLKYCGVVEKGSDAKAIIKEGKILVNGVVEKRRGRKLIKGDMVKAGDSWECTVN